MEANTYAAEIHSALAGLAAGELAAGTKRYIEMQVRVAAEPSRLVNLAIDRQFQAEERPNIRNVVEQARAAVEQLQNLHPGWQQFIGKYTDNERDSSKKVDPDSQQLVPADAEVAGPSATTSSSVGQAEVRLGI